MVWIVELVLCLSVVLSACGESSHQVEPPPESGGDGGAAGSEPESGGGGGGSAGGGADESSLFDELVGTAGDRNDIASGEVCERIATIQCAGEASCCDAPGRDFEACKATMKQGCIDELFLDAMTANPITGYDRQLAADVFAEYEDLARRCDLSVAQWGASMDGLRALTRGTLAAGAACQPAALDLLMPGPRAAAFLLACTSFETHACFPKAAGWSCAPREPEGGACFMDMNCVDGLFCTNSKARNLQGGTCNARKADGAPCDFSSECASLACKRSACAARTQHNIFCLQ
jgi:hypothetical protein